MNPNINKIESHPSYLAQIPAQVVESTLSTAAGITAMALSTATLGIFPKACPHLEERANLMLSRSKNLLAEPYRSFTKACDSSNEFKKRSDALFSSNVLSLFQKAIDTSKIIDNFYLKQVYLTPILLAGSITLAVAGAADVALGLIAATFGILGNSLVACSFLSPNRVNKINEIAYCQLQALSTLFYQSLNCLQLTVDIRRFIKQNEQVEVKDTSPEKLQQQFYTNTIASIEEDLKENKPVSQIQEKVHDFLILFQGKNLNEVNRYFENLFNEIQKEKDRIESDYNVNELSALQLEIQLAILQKSFQSNLPLDEIKDRTYDLFAWTALHTTVMDAKNPKNKISDTIQKEINRIAKNRVETSIQKILEKESDESKRRELLSRWENVKNSSSQEDEAINISKLIRVPRDSFENFDARDSFENFDAFVHLLLPWQELQNASLLQKDKSNAEKLQKLRRLWKEIPKDSASDQRIEELFFLCDQIQNFSSLQEANKNTPLERINSFHKWIKKTDLNINIYRRFFQQIYNLLTKEIEDYAHDDINDAERFQRVWVLVKLTELQKNIKANVSFSQIKKEVHTFCALVILYTNDFQYYHRVLSNVFLSVKKSKHITQDFQKKLHTLQNELFSPSKALKQIEGKSFLNKITPFLKWIITADLTAEQLEAYSGQIIGSLNKALKPNKYPYSKELYKELYSEVKFTELEKSIEIKSSSEKMKKKFNDIINWLNNNKFGEDVISNVKKGFLPEIYLLEIEELSQKDSSSTEIIEKINQLKDFFQENGFDEDTITEYNNKLFSILQKAKPSIEKQQSQQELTFAHLRDQVSLVFS